MYIKSIHIVAFGGVENRKLSFSPGYGVIYGENEWGKTTVMRFIRMMLYGKAERNFREKIRPFSGVTPCGEMELVVEGKTYRIEKTFMASERTDKVRVVCINTDTELALAPHEEVGERLLGIDAIGFMKCMYIPDDDIEKDLGVDTSLSARLSNLIDSGQEAVSGKKTIDNINKAIKDTEKQIKELRTVCTQLELEAAEVFRQKQQAEALYREKQELMQASCEVKEKKQSLMLAIEAQRARDRLTQDRAEEARQQKIKQAEEKLGFLAIPLDTAERFLEECRQLYYRYAALPEGMGIAVPSEAKTAYEVLRQREAQLCSEDSAGQAPKTLPFGVIMLFALTAVFALLASKLLWLLLPAGVCFVFAVLLLFRLSKQKKQQQTDAETRAAALKKTTEEADAFIKKYGFSTREAWEKNQQLLEASCEAASKREQARQRFLEKIKQLCPVATEEEGIKQIERLEPLVKELSHLKRQEALPRLTQEEIKTLTALAQSTDAPADHHALNAVEQEHSQLLERLMALSSRIRFPDKDEETLRRAIRQKREREERLFAYKNSLEIAKEAYEAAIAEMNRDYRPELDALVSKYAEEMTIHHYDDIHIKDNGSLTVHSMATEHDAKRLSRGTIAQLYLCMRLAYGALLGKRTEPVFLVLDDALADFDAERTKAAETLLKKEAEASLSQILLFTCHDRFKE